MSNICFTTYKVVGCKDNVNELYETIRDLDARKIPLVENEWYHPQLWLGCLVKALGGNPDEINCRGTITTYEMCDDVLTISTETSWKEMSETRHFIETYFPNIKIYYLEEEEGCERFYTNDVNKLYFKERYYLEGFDDNRYFETITEVAEYVKQIVGHKIEATFNVVVNALETYVNDNEMDNDIYYNLHKFKVVND